MSAGLSVFHCHGHDEPGALGDELSAYEGAKVWDAYVGGDDI